MPTAVPTQVTGEAYTAERGDDPEADPDDNEMDDDDDWRRSSEEEDWKRLAASPPSDKDKDPMDEPRETDKELYDYINDGMNTNPEKMENNFLEAMSNDTMMIKQGMSTRLEESEKKTEAKVKAVSTQLKKHSDKTNKHMQDLMQRVTELEKERPKKEEKPEASILQRRRAEPEGGPAGLHDPLQDRDPWAPFRGASPRATPTRPPPSPLHPELGTYDSKFIPRAIILKRWYRYGENKGLSEAAAKALAAKVLPLLPADLRSEVIDISAPYAINRQVTLRIQGGGGRCWALRSVLSAELLRNPVECKGRHHSGPASVCSF